MKKPYIVTIHDFQHEYYPDFFTLLERFSRKIGYRTAQKASMVICESEYVKNDIKKFLGVNEDKIKVIPSPPPSCFYKLKLDFNKFKQIKEKYELPEKYLFYPAQFWYHKNHINLIRALKFIKDKYKIEILLILVGSKKNNFENVMNEIQKLGLDQQVKYLGYVPDEDMPYLYKLATALVMPTLFESVSMPIWEAFYLGCPVISSYACALPEQVGDAGLLFDPYNIEDIAEKIYNIWTNENLRKELINKGFERVKDLTIENYAKEWEKILEEVL
jgi:glycosyltransferase involved in cell wall biosynthesis